MVHDGIKYKVIIWNMVINDIHGIYFGELSFMEHGD